MQGIEHSAGREEAAAQAVAMAPGAAPEALRARAAHAPDLAEERAARVSLRGQIARLERELSSILADRFPFLDAPPLVTPQRAAAGGPTLQGLGELERTRDGLANRLQELRGRARRRSEHERRAAELLERMRLEPGRYKNYRLPVRDLGQNGCGVYEVRPRLGLIGMLAGWWQLTLSSGCPLAKGPRIARPRRLPLVRGPRVARRQRVSLVRGPRVARRQRVSLVRGPRVARRQRVSLVRGPRVARPRRVCLFVGPAWAPRGAAPREPLTRRPGGGPPGHGHAQTERPSAASARPGAGPKPRPRLEARSIAASVRR